MSMTKVNEERVQEIFNSISSDYDKMNAIISFKQHDLWRAKTLNFSKEMQWHYLLKMKILM